MTDSNKGMNPLHFGSNLMNTCVQISPEIWIHILDHFLSRDAMHKRGLYHHVVSV